jgi:hypothetical protein
LGCRFLGQANQCRIVSPGQLHQPTLQRRRQIHRRSQIEKEQAKGTGTEQPDGRFSGGGYIRGPDKR